MTPPGTRLRNIRVDDALWDEAQTIARSRGENLSQHVLRPALTNYIKKHQTKESK